MTFENGMSRLSKGNEVFGAVIRLDAVDVVDIFVGAKAATVGLFPDKSVFKDVTALVRKMMTGQPEQNVTEPIDEAAALPVVMQFTLGCTVMAVSVCLAVFRLGIAGRPVGKSLSNRSSATASTDCTGLDSISNVLSSALGVSGALKVAINVLGGMVLMVFLGRDFLAATTGTDSHSYTSVFDAAIVA